MAGLKIHEDPPRRNHKIWQHAQFSALICSARKKIAMMQKSWGLAQAQRWRAGWPHTAQRSGALIVLEMQKLKILANLEPRVRNQKFDKRSVLNV